MCSLPFLVRTENTSNVCPVENTCFFWLLWSKKRDTLHQATQRRSTQTGCEDVTFHNKKESSSHQPVSTDHVEGVSNQFQMFLRFKFKKINDHNLKYLHQYFYTCWLHLRKRVFPSGASWQWGLLLWQRKEEVICGFFPRCLRWIKESRGCWSLVRSRSDRSQPGSQSVSQSTSQRDLRLHGRSSVWISLLLLSSFFPLLIPPRGCTTQSLQRTFGSLDFIPSDGLATPTRWIEMGKLHSKHGKVCLITERNDGCCCCSTF